MPSSAAAADLLEHGGGHGAGPGEGVGGARHAAEPLLALLLLVDEVAPRPVGAVAHDPVLLAVLGLVFVVPNNVLLQKKKREYYRVWSGRQGQVNLPLVRACREQTGTALRRDRFLSP